MRDALFAHRNAMPPLFLQAARRSGPITRRHPPYVPQGYSSASGEPPMAGLNDIDRDDGLVEIADSDDEIMMPAAMTMGR